MSAYFEMLNRYGDKVNPVVSSITLMYVFGKTDVATDAANDYLKAAAELAALQASNDAMKRALEEISRRAQAGISGSARDDALTLAGIRNLADAVTK
jgi:hypothetical protein